jgi:hypothetical protein
MMALPLAAIARLIGQLTVLVPAADALLRSLRGTVAKMPENAAVTEYFDDFERALKLQLEVTENLTKQLHTVQSALTGIEKSLKLLTVFIIAVAALAALALAVALLK